MPLRKEEVEGVESVHGRQWVDQGLAGEEVKEVEEGEEGKKRGEREEGEQRNG